MSPLNQNGLLGKEVRKLIARNRSQHAKHFEFAEKLNVFCHRILEQLVLIPVDGNEINKELIIRTCFIRSLNTYNCAIVLFERQMTTQAGVLLRCLIELKNTITATINREEFIEEYLKANDFSEKISDMNALTSNLAKEINDPEIANRLSELNQEIEKRKKDSKSPRKIANYASFDEEYKLVYGSLCRCVHPSFKGLVEDHINFEEHSIKSLNYFPPLTNYDRFFSHTIIAMLYLAEEINNYYRLNLNEEVKTLNVEFKNIFMNRQNLP